MKKCYLRITTIILTTLMTVSVLGACRKDGEGSSQSQSGTKQINASAAKTAGKTSAAANATTGAAAASATTTTGETDTAITETNKTGDAADSQSEGQQSDWAQDIDIGGIGEVVKEDIDLKGATIILGTWASRYIPADTPETLPELVVWARRLKAAEQKYNFKTELYLEPGENSTNYKKT